MKKLYFLFLLLTSSVSWLAQAQSQDIAVALPSPKGVYIRLKTDYIAGTTLGKSKYVIKRKKIIESTSKSIGQMQLAKDYNDFLRIVGRKSLRDFEKMKKFYGASETMAFMYSSPAYKTVAAFAELKIEFLQAFGYAFLDSTAQKNELYNYEVFELLSNKEEKLISTISVFSNPKNFALKQYVPQINKIVGSDSSVVFEWKITSPPYVDKSAEMAKLGAQIEQAFQAKANQNAQRIDESAYINVKKLYLDNEQSLSIYPTDDFTTRYNVYYRKNGSVQWQFLEKNVANNDPLGNHILTARVPGKRDDLVETIVIPEDFVYNTGDTSSVTRGVIAHNGSVELIYGVKSSDSTNAIILQWKKLADKPYYAGVEIAKAAGNEEPKVIQVLPSTASKFIDTDVFPAGQMFKYFVRPIFIPFQELKQEIPATTTMTCGKFSRPTPPFNLTVQSEGPNARLKWDVADEKAGHSYFVYRGTSPTKMIPIRSAVKEKQYLDTTSYLTGRSTYYYAIMAVNVTQDTSDFSPYVMYSPNKVEPVQSPSNIGFEVINEKAHLSWNDVRLNDDFIAGYALQRKKQGETSFKNIHTSVLTASNFVDDSFELGVNYLYRVASITLKGDTSYFSPEVTVQTPKLKNTLVGISGISLSNLSESIKIAWPSVEVGAVKGYKVYRKLPTEINFKLIGSVSSGNFEFQDKNVKPDVIYVYTVTKIDDTNAESSVEERKSIYREKVRK
ncbi:MAG: hypothetical protein ACOVQ4_22100 [Flectobacillus sp.]|uniref:hypothetical protein n=1 Tax=Flectobacillus sp. TaxID=50419 RepID=UPI003B9C8EE8